MTSESRTPAADYLRGHFCQGQLLDSFSVSEETWDAHRLFRGGLNYDLHIPGIHVCSLGSVIRSYGIEGARGYQEWHPRLYGQSVAEYNDLPSTTAEDAAARVAQWEREKEEA